MKSQSANMSREVHIAGAGPSGLAAALVAAKAGMHVVVHERRQDVGSRFHGDFQGLENWSTEGDVLDDLARQGIEPNFEAVPIREQVLFNPDGREYVYRSEQPFYYLVRRGTGPGTLDQGLKEQALANGVDLRFRDSVQHLPGHGVIATGPGRVFAIVVGYLFDTDAADATFTAMGERLAPNGYSYLLINRGRGTLASCIFRDFHNQRRYLEGTLDFFRSKVNFNMRNIRRYGGYGNLVAPRAGQHDHRRVVGEAGGFQDALWGFGIRISLVSGYLAGAAIVNGSTDPYDRLLEQRLMAAYRTSVVNRFFYGKLGDPGYRKLGYRLASARSPRGWLRKHYGASRWKSWLFPVVRRAVLSRKEIVRAEQLCDCLICQPDRLGDPLGETAPFESSRQGGLVSEASFRTGSLEDADGDRA